MLQMPIVDGLTSTKMIRSFEKTHAGDILSTRAALCGRIPIIAVSASLVEREVKTYINTGFDAWILKPISFARLSELMTAIVDSDIRRKCLYQKGQWECGGWFHTGEASAHDVSTAPSGEPQKSNPSAIVQGVAPSGETTAGDQKGETEAPQEQLAEVQDKGKAKVEGDPLDSATENPPAPSDSA
jgi:CheY-like chemotaxis protein